MVETEARSGESGIATLEFAVTVLLLMAVLLGVLATMDAVYMQTLTKHVATAIGRQAVYRPEGHWADLIQSGGAMMAANRGWQQDSQACKDLCKSRCDTPCTADSPATCIRIYEDRDTVWEDVLGITNSTVVIRVDHYVSIPMISQTYLFTNTLKCFAVGAEYKVSLWNAGVVFNTPQR